MKYRKKPVEIEAVQFADDPDTLIKINDVLGLDPVRVSHKDPDNPIFNIPTRAGTVFAHIGDYIIKDHGEFYPLRPDIFEETYEPSGAQVDGKLLAKELAKPIKHEIDKQSRREQRRKGFL